MQRYYSLCNFLDASKAFDRLNYWLLFDKLIKKHVPLFIVKLLLFWYTHQKMCVRWGNLTSPDFLVDNGDDLSHGTCKEGLFLPYCSTYI